MSIITKVIHFLRAYRFELFLITIFFNLFSGIIFNNEFFLNYVSQIGWLLNVLAGINLIEKRKIRLLLSTLFLVTGFLLGFSVFSTDNLIFTQLSFCFYFLLYVIISYEIIKQIWSTKEVTKDLIYGVMSGYISLGLVGYFIFAAVEIAFPGSFSSSLFSENMSIGEKSDSLLYFSFITLMTIGYGEILPATATAQKASILLGLMGQFYLVIITAVVVGKYMKYKIR